MFTAMMDDILRFWGRFDSGDPWCGSEGTFAEFFKREFMEIAAICSWRKEGVGAYYNKETHSVEIRTADGDKLATITVRGVLDRPDSVAVHAHTLTERERGFITRRFPIPVTFTGNIS